jgi:hypothetical protein
MKKMKLSTPHVSTGSRKNLMADITYSTGTKKLEVDLPRQPQETGKN